MKQIAKNTLLGVFIISVFSFIFIKILKSSVLAVIVILTVICLYVVCMGVCEESMKQLKKYEIIQMRVELTQQQRLFVLFFSLTTLFPTYFCVLLVSVIPMFTYEVWFITVFPCLIIISMPMLSILEEYFILTKKKLPFLASFAAIVIVLLSVGIASSSLLMNSIQ